MLCWSWGLRGSTVISLSASPFLLSTSNKPHKTHPAAASALGVVLSDLPCGLTVLELPEPTGCPDLPGLCQQLHLPEALSPLLSWGLPALWFPSWLHIDLVLANLFHVFLLPYGCLVTAVTGYCFAASGLPAAGVSLTTVAVWWQLEKPAAFSEG